MILGCLWGCGQDRHSEVQTVVSDSFGESETWVQSHVHQSPAPGFRDQGNSYYGGGGVVVGLGILLGIKVRYLPFWAIYMDQVTVWRSVPVSPSLLLQSIYPRTEFCE
jgi:hypothetical protein